MSRSKQEFINRTGGYRIGEGQQEFVNRVREINDLETKLKSGQISFEDMESIQRRLCELKGISFDFDDDEEEFD
ncbi:hypothetical protein G6M50_14875 [Agrobacterium rhizogenes]|nr:hypothetical protein [Rhizobium rhizogenes]NTJ79075.1 hypothetical protein [Rhizobium rhizogenes]